MAFQTEMSLSHLWKPAWMQRNLGFNDKNCLRHLWYKGFASPELSRTNVDHKWASAQTSERSKTHSCWEVREGKSGMIQGERNTFPHNQQGWEEAQWPKVEKRQVGNSSTHTSLSDGSAFPYSMAMVYSILQYTLNFHFSVQIFTAFPSSCGFYNPRRERGGTKSCKPKGVWVWGGLCVLWFLQLWPEKRYLR